MNRLRHQLLAGARFAQDQHARVRRRHEGDLLERLLKGGAPADDAARHRPRVLTQIGVLQGELLAESADLLEGTGMRDGHRGVVGEHAQPGEGVLVERRAGEDGQHPEDLVPEQQGMASEAPDALAQGPLRAGDPGGIVRHLLDQDALPGGADAADLADVQGDAPEVAVQARPVLGRASRSAGARHEPEATGLVRALAPHVAAVTDVARREEPHAG